MNIFKQLVVSNYSPKDIASFRLQRTGKTVLYVFLLSFLSVIPTIVYFSTELNKSIDNITVAIEESFPQFNIKNGQLKSDTQEQITTVQDNLTIYFDSTGELTANELDPTESSIAFLKNEFVITSAGMVEPISYAMLNNIEISKDQLTDFLSKIETLLPLLSIIPIFFIFIFASAMKFIEVSILGIMGSLIGSIGRKTFPYRSFWNLAAYSATLSTVFFMIMEFLQTTVPLGFMLNWFVSLIILYLTLKELKPTHS